MPGHGSFYWNELTTSDVDGAKNFYTQVCGWSYREMDMGEAGTYTILQSGDADVGRLMAMPAAAPQGTPPHWMSYVNVDDVDGAAGRAGDNGGQVMVPPFDIPGVGRMCVIRDPQGAVLSLMTPKPDD